MSNRTKLPGCGLLAVLSLACANAAGAPPVPRAAPIDGNDYYQRKYWHPRAYWEWQDRQWGVDPSGTVVVQPVQRVEDGT